MKLHVNLGENSYDIVIEKGLLKKASEEIREVYSGKRIAVISDDSVYGFYGGELLNQLKSTWECSTVILPHGETSKSINVLPGVYAKLLESGLSRSDLIVALGGRRHRRFGRICGSYLSAGSPVYPDSHIPSGSGRFFRGRKSRSGFKRRQKSRGIILSAEESTDRS